MDIEPSILKDAISLFEQLELLIDYKPNGLEKYSVLVRLKNPEIDHNLFDKLFEVVSYKKYPRSLKHHECLNEYFEILWKYAYNTYPDIFHKHKLIIDVMGKNCLHHLLRSRDHPPLRELLENTRDIDINLVAYDEIVRANFELDTSLVPNHENFGATPLLDARLNMHNDEVQLLIKFGADPEIRDKFGRTYKDWSIWYRQQYDEHYY